MRHRTNYTQSLIIQHLIDTLPESDATDRAIFINYETNNDTSRSPLTIGSLWQLHILGKPTVLITIELSFLINIHIDMLTWLTHPEGPALYFIAIDMAYLVGLVF